MKNKFNVLVVDDEMDILELVSEEFRFKGHNVVTASSGNEAIEILKNNRFDVIVSDFKMPNGNGMTILNFVSSQIPKIHFFFLSGQADLSAEECLKAGAVAFFSKPFDLAELVLKIEEMID